MLDRECGHIRDEATEHRLECERRIRRVVGRFVGYAATEFTRCSAERFIEEERREHVHEDLPEMHVLDLLFGWLVDVHDICERTNPEAPCCDLYDAEAVRF